MKTQLFFEGLSLYPQTSPLHLSTRPPCLSCPHFAAFSHFWSKHPRSPLTSTSCGATNPDGQIDGTRCDDGQKGGVFPPGIRLLVYSSAPGIVVSVPASTQTDKEDTWSRLASCEDDAGNVPLCSLDETLPSARDGDLRLCVWEQLRSFCPRQTAPVVLHWCYQTVRPSQVL